LGMPTSVSCLIFKTLLFILFPISIDVFRRGTPCIPVYVNVLANRFVESVSNVLNEMCPKRKVIFKSKYLNKAWITADIRQSMQHRDALYVRATPENNEEIWKEFKNMRNYVVNEIRSEKYKYFRNFIDGNKYNSREMWKQLKTLLPNNNSSSPDGVIFESKKINDELLIAEKFNSYLVNSISEIVNNVPRGAVSDPTLLYTYELKYTFSKFERISMAELKRILKSIVTIFPWVYTKSI